jgi:small subunit ribosomal protein S8
MTVSDPIGDLITRIRNAQKAGKKSLTSPHSKFREQVLSVLQKEGYIRGYSVADVRAGLKELTVELKYIDNQPVITKITKQSTPGMRVYVGVEKMPKVCNGLGISILSTSHGVMSDIDARAHNIGGELLCTVF